MAHRWPRLLDRRVPGRTGHSRDVRAAPTDHADRRARVLLLERKRGPRLAPAALQSRLVPRLPPRARVLAGLPPHPRLPGSLHRRLRHVREVLDHDHEHGARRRRSSDRVERDADSWIPAGSSDLTAGARPVHPRGGGDFRSLGGRPRGGRRHDRDGRECLGHGRLALCRHHDPNVRGDRAGADDGDASRVAPVLRRGRITVERLAPRAPRRPNHRSPVRLAEVVPWRFLTCKHTFIRRFGASCLSPNVTPGRRADTTACDCPPLTTTVAGSPLVFACSANPALSLAATATGTVTYSAFSPAPPVSILDIYLIDTVATLGATCGTTSSNGNEPVALAVGGGSITVSQSAGNPRPGHNYDYCMDFAVLPPSFSTGVSWSQ